MKIKSGPVQTALAIVVAIVMMIVCMNLFGVFKGHDSVREAIRASKGTVAFSMGIGFMSYLATIWITSLNRKELEQLEVRASISGDIAKTTASLRHIQTLTKENALDDKTLKVTKFVLNSGDLSIRALNDNVQPQDMAMAFKLFDLTKSYETALVAFIANSKQAEFDSEAREEAEKFTANAPLMLIGLVNLMKEIQSNDGSLTTATDEIMAKLGAWGYVGEMDKLNLKKGSKK